MCANIPCVSALARSGGALPLMVLAEAVHEDDRSFLSAGGRRV
jgi:hypothetical protein